MDITSKSPASSRQLNQLTSVDHPPRRLGEIANKIVAETGQKAVHHWLDKATRAENQQERAAALEIAENIAKALGLTVEDFLFRRAA